MNYGLLILLFIVLIVLIYAVYGKASTSSTTPGNAIIITPDDAEPGVIAPAADVYIEDNPGIAIGSDPFNEVEEVYAPLVLYTQPGYKGSAIPITEGRNINLGYLSPQGQGNCLAKSADETRETSLTTSEALRCWTFYYSSLKADPNYYIDLWRESGGHRYDMRLDPAKTGNMPLLNASVLESYVDYSSGNPYSSTKYDNLHLPYYYHFGDIYIRVTKKPIADN